MFSFASLTEITVGVVAITGEPAAAAPVVGVAIRLVSDPPMPEAKMALLHRAAGDTGIADLDLLPPTLDELYAHFLRDEGGLGA